MSGQINTSPIHAQLRYYLTSPALNLSFPSTKTGHSQYWRAALKPTRLVLRSWKHLPAPSIIAGAHEILWRFEYLRLQNTSKPLSPTSRGQASNQSSLSGKETFRVCVPVVCTLVLLGMPPLTVPGVPIVGDAAPSMVITRSHALRFRLAGHGREIIS